MTDNPPTLGRKFLAAAVNLSSTSDEEANWRDAKIQIDRAVQQGARFVATPENTNFLGPHEVKVQRAETLEGATCQRFAELAARHRIHLLLGSFNEKSNEPSRCYNTSVFFGPDGAILGTYRKLHLFDVDLSEEVRFLESLTCKPGSDVACVSSGLGRMGLTICYDLRFPELYRKLLDLGAQILCVPSAFTMSTGKDHWRVLLRARAIETQCWVIAPAQCGHHDDDGLRHSYGHSMIVDPWGVVRAEIGDDPGIALAEVDLELLASIRRGLPVSEHRRLGLGELPEADTPCETDTPCEADH